MLPISSPRPSASNDATDSPSTFVSRFSPMYLLPSNTSQQTTRSAPQQKREGTETRLLNQAERGENITHDANATAPQDLRRRSAHHSSRYPSRLPGPSTSTLSVGTSSRLSSLGTSSCSTGLNGLRQQTYNSPTSELQASIERQGEVTRRKTADLTAVSEDGCSKKSRKSVESLPWLRPTSLVPDIPITAIAAAATATATASVGDESEGSGDKDMTGPLMHILDPITGPQMDIAEPRNYAEREMRVEAHMFGMLKGVPKVENPRCMAGDGQEGEEETEVTPERRYPQRPDRAVLRDANGPTFCEALGQTISTDAAVDNAGNRSTPRTKGDPEARLGLLSAISQRFSGVKNSFPRSIETPSSEAAVNLSTTAPFESSMAEEPKEETSSAPHQTSQEEEKTTKEAKTPTLSTWPWYQILFTALFFLSSGIGLIILLSLYKISLGSHLSSSLWDWRAANLRAFKGKQGGILELLDISNGTLTMRINQTLKADMVSIAAGRKPVFNFSYNATIAGLRNISQGESPNMLPVPSFSGVFLFCILVCGVYQAFHVPLRWWFDWMERRWRKKDEWETEAAICFFPFWRWFVKWRGFLAVMGAALLACGSLASVLRAYLRGLKGGG